MINDETEQTPEASAAAAPSDEDQLGPSIVVFVDEAGEVQVATKGRQFHPEEIIKMFGVAIAKLELMQFQMMRQQIIAQQRQQANPLLIARRDVSGLDL